MNELFEKLKNGDVVRISGGERVLVIDATLDSDSHIMCVVIDTNRRVWIAKETYLEAIEFSLDELDEM